MNVEDVVDVVGVADEVALVVDVDADYEDADSDFAEEQVLVVSCIETRTDLVLASLEMSQLDSDHVVLF